ncbi:MAG: carboxypeptidase regulatory-like domain-containing protein [Gemmatimonadales bacterium]|nr:carboxypeptidase regulatory-like domain-containing protein [Gemmatimonadales bacterium]
MARIIPWRSIVVGAAVTLAFSTAAAPSALGQRVMVRTVEAETRLPVIGAIVRLVDSAGRAVAQGLTTESGRILLGAAGPGRFRLRADRIGHEGVWSDPFELVDSLGLELTMPLDPVVLPELAVRGSSSCAVRADGQETAALWEEIRKALAAGEITSSGQAVELSVRRYLRFRGTDGRLRTDSTLRLQLTRASPFVSPPPELLASEGYIREPVEGSFLFHAPDLPTLLSPGFLETHCFEVTKPPRDAPHLIGLGFRPTREVRRPDIRGTLWVDRESHELRFLEFSFVRAPASVAAPGIGGRIDFRRLASGAWIVADWYIRVPDRVVIERQQRSRLNRRDSLAGYVDEGGTARPVGDATVAMGEAVTRLRTGPAVSGDVRGRVVGPDRTPIAGAEVAIAEIDTTLTTDAEGRFELRDLPAGRLRLRIRAVGFVPMAIAMSLREGRRLVDTTVVLARAAQLLDSVVVTAKTPTFEAGKMADVERRRRAGFGRFLTREVLHDPLQGGLDIQLRRFSRMRMAPLCGGRGFAPASATRGTPPVRVRCGNVELNDCFMAVYLDGALYWSPDMGGVVQPPDFATFVPTQFEAIEIYRSAAETPIEFTGPTAGCGVVLLWTRIG